MKKKYLMGLMSPLTTRQHDGAAVLLRNGKVKFCGEEERYIRYKHSRGHIPINAISAGLKFCKINLKQVDTIYISSAEHPDLKKRIQLYLNHYFGFVPKIHMIDHQLCHLASAYYPSNFDNAMILSIDGMGDFKSMITAKGVNGKITFLNTKDESQSLGIFYQTMTQYIGFSGLGDEYKFMGLSAAGSKKINLDKIIKVGRYDFKINDKFLKRKPKHKNLFEPRYGKELVRLYGKPRFKGEKIKEFHKNFAYSVQNVFENAVIATVRKLHKQTGLRNLCIAGGCALNCVANMKLKNLDFIDKIFVQPAATDQGTALGAVLYGSLINKIKIKPINNYYLGSSYTDKNIKDLLDLCNIKYQKINNLPLKVAKSIAKGKVIGLYHGRSEFGPRALGNRSILANPSISNIKDIVNMKIKFREEFRPFAPTILSEKAKEVFYINEDSPFMTITMKVRENWIKKIPGVVHIDKTSRVQTVNKKENLIYYNIIKEFFKITEIPLVLNTSFNIRGEPMVEKPLDAIRTFFGSGLDELYIANFLIKK